MLPIVLILLAILAALFFTFGTFSFWGSYPHGISLIIWSRRLEWPLVVTAILLAILLAILVVSRRIKARWLIGLLPVASLFFFRLTHSPNAGWNVLQDPRFISTAAAKSLPATDQVVGLIVDGHPLAFACTSLAETPVIVRTGRDKPLVLLWTPWANRALAFTADREFRAGYLELVSAPDNTLVIYNSRLGEFINSMTGRTFDGAVPTGLHAQIPLIKTTWKNWQAMHPDTVIAALPGPNGDFSKPLPQKDILPGNDPALRDQRLVCFVAATQPIAVPSESITERPLNLDSGQTPVLLVRVNGVVRAFSRELPGDLIPRFSPTVDLKHKNAAWIDSDTNSEWTDSGVQVEGPPATHGLALRPIPVEDRICWNVMKFWYPDLKLASDIEIAAAGVVEKQPVEKPAAKSAGGG